MMTDSHKTLTNSMDAASAHVDTHHKKAMMLVNKDKQPVEAKEVSATAVKSSEIVAKKAVENHHVLTSKVAEKAAASGDKETAKKAAESSKDVTAHSKSEDNAAHGMSMGDILMYIVLVLAVLYALYIVFM
jgi:cobalamin biosynthesis Mg chelatase CobN